MPKTGNAVGSSTVKDFVNDSDRLLSNNQLLNTSFQLGNDESFLNISLNDRLNLSALNTSAVQNETTLSAAAEKQERQNKASVQKQISRSFPALPSNVFELLSQMKLVMVSDHEGMNDSSTELGPFAVLTTSAGHSGGNKSLKTASNQKRHNSLLQLQLLLFSPANLSRISDIFRILALIKASKYELRGIWMWLYKTFNKDSSSNKRRGSSVGAGKSMSKKTNNFLNSLYLKLGILRHHMQHFVDFMEEYYTFDVVGYCYSEELEKKLDVALDGALDGTGSSINTAVGGQFANRKNGKSKNSTTLLIPQILDIFNNFLAITAKKAFLTQKKPEKGGNTVLEAIVQMLSGIFKLRRILGLVVEEKDLFKPAILYQLKEIDAGFHANKKIVQSVSEFRNKDVFF